MSTTLDTYAHVTDDMIHDAAEKISGVMKNTI